MWQGANWWGPLTGASYPNARADIGLALSPCGEGYWHREPGRGLALRGVVDATRIPPEGERIAHLGRAFSQVQMRVFDARRLADVEEDRASQM